MPQVFMLFLTPNQQRQGTTRNSKHRCHPVAWHYPFFIRHRELELPPFCRLSDVSNDINLLYEILSSILGEIICYTILVSRQRILTTGRTAGGFFIGKI